MHGYPGALVIEVGVQMAVASRCPCTDTFVLAKKLLAHKCKYVNLAKRTAKNMSNTNKNFYVVVYVFKQK